MNNITTIQEALVAYRADPGACVSLGYKSAVEVIVKNQIEDALKNDSYLDALYLTDLMFNKTNDRVSIITSSGIDLFIEALGSSFEKMLNRIKKSSGYARMILLDGQINGALTKIAESFKGTLEIKLGATKQGAEVQHFIVCDNNMLRVEQPHVKLSPVSEITSVKAAVYFNNKTETLRYSGFFDAAWKILSE